MDKQTLLQEVQSLTGVIEHLGITTVKSVDDFLHRLKLDLNLFPVDKLLNQDLQERYTSCPYERRSSNT